MSRQGFYFDDPEGEGPSRETSHPNFAAKMTEDFYYDCADDFSPFGNDDGADTLGYLEEWYDETGGKGDIMKWLFKYIDSLGFEYESESAYKILDEEEITELQHEDPYFLHTMDNAIIAAAFGQYKITGTINSQLREAALVAIKRLKMVTTEENVAELLEEFNRVYDIMDRDLRSLTP